MSNGYYFCAGFGLGSVNLERNPPIPVYVESPVWVLTEMGFLPLVKGWGVGFFRSAFTNLVQTKNTILLQISN